MANDEWLISYEFFFAGENPPVFCVLKVPAIPDERRCRDAQFGRLYKRPLCLHRVLGG